MNNCASCGASISEGEAFCSRCGAAVPAVARPPSPWRRVATAAAALPFLGGGASLVAYTASLDSEDPQAGLGYFFGAIIMFLGLPFAVATVLPFGQFRRVIVGFGAALLGFIAFSSFSFALGPLGSLVGLGGAIAMFYLGYRKAR